MNFCRSLKISLYALSKRQTKMLLVAYCRLKGRIHNMNVDGEINLSNFETKPDDMEQEKDELLRPKENTNPFSTLLRTNYPL